MFLFNYNKKNKIRSSNNKNKITGSKTKLARQNTTQYKLVYLVILFLLVYIIMSIYTPWTGYFGNLLSSSLLESVGGSIIILLLFLSYVLLFKLLSWNIPRFYGQFLATILLFLDASLLLGLNVLTQKSNIFMTPWLNPGKLGIKLSQISFSLLGIVGTLLMGVITIYLSLILYGIKIYLKFPYLTKLYQYLKDFRITKYFNFIRLKNRKTTAEAPNILDIKNDNYNYFDVTKNIAEIEIQEEEKVKKTNKQKIGLDLSTNTSNNDNLLDKIEQGVFPPPLEIFGIEEIVEDAMNEKKAEPFGHKIIETLEQFGIEAYLAEILVGPTVIQFRIQLAPGIKVNKVAALGKDIALAIAVPSLRIEAPIPGKPYIGIEIPNPNRKGIPLRTIISNPSFHNSEHLLPLPFGLAVNGEPVVVGLEKLPHLLVSGTTGSGKSVFINSCIVGLCSTRTPDELRMILVDPKRVEMSVYDRLPHLLTPPVTDTKKAVHILAWAIREMEKRYSSFANIRVRNLKSFNEKVLPKDKLPLIVIIVDELADLMMTAPKEVEEYICRLSQMARATGIHLILATQRPSVNVITGLIKANIPARVAFTLPSNADSRTILDAAGAEKLLGRGDMLFLSTKYPKPIRIQAPWVADNILSNWLHYLHNTFGEPDFIEIKEQSNLVSSINGKKFEDELLEDAVEVIMNTGIASASGLQRRLRIGFSRASRLIDMMEQMGIVGPAEGPKPREILVEEEKARILLNEEN